MKINALQVEDNELDFSKVLTVDDFPVTLDT